MALSAVSTSHPLRSFFMTQSNPTLHRFDMTAKILAATVVGLLVGLFFGDYCSWLKWIGDGFIGLLQMAVLPYITLSLIVNIGRLNITQCWRLAKVAPVVMGGLWLLALGLLAVISWSFPTRQAGSLFSTSFLQDPPAYNWLELFIPSNPFHSLSSSAIPAVVVFSIGLGVALIGFPNKSVFLDPCNVVIKALSQLNHFILQLSPFGIFAIVAHAAGTLDLDHFELLQGYLLAYGTAAALLTLWILPAAVNLLTPISYRHFLQITRDALATAFVVGNTFIVLPMIVDSTKQLFNRYGLLAKGSDDLPELIVPMAYPFPDVGRIVGLLFIPFAAWFYGTPIDAAHLPTLVVVGFLGCFASPLITIPLLLTLAEIPSDIFNLYVVIGILASRFGDAMKTMHLFAFATITSCGLTGNLAIRWARIPFTLVLTIGCLAVTMVGVHKWLDRSFSKGYLLENLVTERALITKPAPFTILEQADPNPSPLQAGESRLERIRRRGVIRIGFDDDELPFSYFNDSSLVGFDIDMAHQLARDLKVAIEFVPFASRDITDQLRGDYFDIAMSGIEGTMKRLSALPPGEPYMEVTLALVVLDHRRTEFDAIRKLQGNEDVRIAVIADSFFAEMLKEIAGDLDVIELDSERDFFNASVPQADALLTSAETGSAWTLLRPTYSVVRPTKQTIRIPLYYLTAPDQRFRAFLDRWLDLKRGDRTLDKFYDHWILGKPAHDPTPRWSIIRNVVGWVD